MFTLLFYSHIIHEPYDSINSISFALFLLLIINPFWIFNLGFQLSFVATLSIIIISPGIQELFYPYKSKLTLTLSSLIGVLLGLLPIQAYYFNTISLLSILSNLIIVPLLSISLVLGFIMIFLDFILSSFNYIVGFVLDIILSFQFNIIRLIGHIPFTIIKIYSPDIISIFIYYLIIFLLLKRTYLKNLRISMVKTIVYYLMILLLFNGMATGKDKSVELHFIDVGQGDSILMRTKGGDYLMDTGGSTLDSFDVAKYITLPYLEKLGIKNLRGIFISHFDEDHSKALPLLIENIKVKNIYGSYIPEDSKAYTEILNRKIPYTLLKYKDRILLDDNIELVVLWPDGYKENSMSSNNKSLVTLLSYYNNQILFTGDIEKEAEEIIITRLDKEIDIIKVPHHGSKTSSTKGMLNKLLPDISIISVGRNNFYGHPHEEVINRYNDIHSKIFRTDEMGLIKVTLKEDSIVVDPFIGEHMGKQNPLLAISNNLSIIAYYTLYLIMSYVLIKIYGDERSII